MVKVHVIVVDGRIANLLEIMDGTFNYIANQFNRGHR